MNLVTASWLFLGLAAISGTILVAFQWVFTKSRKSYAIAAGVPLALGLAFLIAFAWARATVERQGIEGNGATGLIQVFGWAMVAVFVLAFIMSHVSAAAKGKNGV